MSISETSPAWYGWLWVGNSWERVCSGTSLGECSDRLSEQAKRRGVPAKHSCMTGGGAPRFIPRDAQHKEMAAHEPN